jgi:DnaJ-class molecular chaperone
MKKIAIVGNGFSSKKIVEILLKNERETIDCEECGGSGFSKAGTGYDAVCDNCGGQGRLPK